MDGSGASCDIPFLGVNSNRRGSDEGSLVRAEALTWWAHKTNSFHIRTLHNYTSTEQKKTSAGESFHKCLIASTSAVSIMMSFASCKL
jgi:hypothetical protein